MTHSTLQDVRPAATAGTGSADVRTAESVTEGHPDKVADYIADSLLDAFLT